jgi:hypothetical protein
MPGEKPVSVPLWAPCTNKDRAGFRPGRSHLPSSCIIFAVCSAAGFFTALPGDEGRFVPCPTDVSIVIKKVFRGGVCVLEINVVVRKCDSIKGYIRFSWVR